LFVTGADRHEIRTCTGIIVFLQPDGAPVTIFILFVGAQNLEPLHEPLRILIILLIIYVTIRFENRTELSCPKIVDRLIGHINTLRGTVTQRHVRPVLIVYFH